MATAWMRHPDLPADQLIEIDERLVPGHRAAGWEVTEAPPKPSRKSEEEASAEQVEETEEPAPERPARRRAPKEAEK
jgi:hypothetical protein